MTHQFTDYASLHAQQQGNLLNQWNAQQQANMMQANANQLAMYQQYMSQQMMQAPQAMLNQLQSQNALNMMNAAPVWNPVFDSAPLFRDWEPEAPAKPQPRLWELRVRFFMLVLRFHAWWLTSS